MSDIFEIHEFFVEGGNQKRSHVLLHITEPTTPEEQEKGYFFALSEIQHGETEQIEHLQRLIDDLESGYYESTDTDEKTAFEASLEFVNRRGHHILQYPKSTIHCVVGVLRGTQLSLATHGAPIAFVSYQSNNGPEHMPITTDNADSTASTQLFSAMIQGTLNSGDFFYVATPHVENYFTPDRIKKLLYSRSIHQTVEHIEHTLEGIGDGMSYGGMIFHVLSKNETHQLSRPAKNSPDHSIPLHHIVDDPPSTTTHTDSSDTIAEDISNESLLNRFLVGLGRGIVLGILGIGHFLKYTAIGMVHFFVGIIVFLTNQGGGRAVVLQNARRSLRSLREHIRHWSLVTKIILGIGVIALLIGIGGYTYTHFKRELATEKTAYLAKIQQIKEKRDEAEASMIYGDEPKALRAYTEAQNLLVQLPNTSPEEKKNQTDLAADLAQTKQKIEKITVVTSPLVADLSTVQQNSAATKLALIDRSIIAYGPLDHSLYTIDTDTQKVEVKNHDTIPRLLSATTPKEQDRIIFLTSSSTVAEYQKKTGVIGALDVPTTQPARGFTDIVVYNQRLYSLDQTNANIIRHNKTQTGFDKGVEWLKTPDINLQDAISLAIDSDIFVLKANGHILKFTNGAAVPFSISGLLPAMEQPTILYTRNGFNNVYVLEPAKKRVIVLDKTGKFVGQYTSVAWQAPSGMVVDEEKKIVYILDQTNVYRFGL